MRSRL
ncbi:hypothetical protein YPPY34_1324, partial [Yersinia pestis PY-34]